MSYVSKLIEDDYDWRVAELGILKRKLSDCKSNQSEEKILIKCLTVMLYAHWEGFAKFSLTAYVEAIERLLSPRRAFSDALVVSSLFARLNKLSDQSLLVRKEFIAKYQDYLEEPIQFPKRIVDTKSNLKSAVLEDVLNKLDLIVTNSDPVLLDSLVDKRNEIAHGQTAPVSTIQAYENIEKVVLTMMMELAIKIDERLDKKEYQKQQQLRDYF